MAPSQLYACAMYAYQFQPLPPGSRLIGGVPAVPPHSSVLRRVALWLTWVMAVVLPVGTIALRLLCGLMGWLMVIYLMYGVVLVGLVQLALGLICTLQSAAWQPRAVGPVTAIASLVYYLGHLLLVVSVGEYGDTGPPVPSVVERMIGGPASDVVVLIGLVALAAGLLTTLVAAFVEPAIARRRGREAFVRRYGSGWSPGR